MAGNSGTPPPLPAPHPQFTSPRSSSFQPIEQARHHRGRRASRETKAILSFGGGCLLGMATSAMCLRLNWLLSCSLRLQPFTDVSIVINCCHHPSCKTTTPYLSFCAEFERHDTRIAPLWLLIRLLFFPPPPRQLLGPPSSGWQGPNHIPSLLN